MNRYRLIAIVALALTLTACASALPNPDLPPDVTGGDQIGGFWWGLWNGWTAPFAFIGSLFDDSIAVYHSPNNGAWYDFGFILGVGGFSFGAGKTR